MIRSITYNRLFWPLVLAIGILGIYLRFVGQNWDEGQQLHPDERFISMVTTSIKIVESWGQYFDTEHSTLNPHNNGFGFYVYGTFPLFFYRFVADLLGPNFNVDLVGRSVSACFDFGTCILVFTTAWILFGRWTGLIAFYICATSVLPIQLSHFLAFDSIGSFFCTLVLLIATLIWKYSTKYTFLLAILAGLFCGLAAATKINLLLVFALIPLSVFASRWEQGKKHALASSIFFSFIGIIALLLGFRVFQPYAFSGPGFFDLTFNPKWVKNLQELANQINTGVDFPPAVQWIERGRLHGLINLCTWGFGLPLGIFILGSYIFSFQRVFWKACVNNKISRFFLPFMWASLSLCVYVFAYAAQPIRYGIPAYPPLIIIAAGLVCSILDSPAVWFLNRWNRLELIAIKAVTIFVLLSSLIWAGAFTSIYRNPNPRVAASRWILSEIPGAISIEGRSNSGQHLFPIAIGGENKVVPLPIDMSVVLPYELLSNKLLISKLVNAQEHEKFSFEISDETKLVTSAELEVNHAQLQHEFQPPVNLKPNLIYHLKIKSLDPNNPSIQKIALLRESSWDDSLPLRVDDFDPYGGIYDGEPNLEIYEKNQFEEAQRMVKNLAESDYFYLSSNRQVATVGRLPEYFPQAALFYQKLLGCSAREYIPQCYAMAQVGDHKGQLGYELVKTFESYPKIFGISFNTQLADESFQVYDHPRVMIFKNKERLSMQELEKLLAPPRFGLLN